MSGARGNLLVLQGGGPTAVINASLSGVIDEAARSGQFSRLLGARSGVEGLARNDVINLSSLAATELVRLKNAPAASLASSRKRISDENLPQILATLRTNNVHALIMIGGNGTLHGASLIARAVNDARLPTVVVGVPKTIDNDIPLTDRCPGFGSAARYVAQSVRDLGMDVRTLPQPVSIFETMGRNAGWVAGASVLAKLDEAHAPHLVYLPENPFDLDRFISNVDRVVTKLGWAVVVVSEGLKNSQGQPVFEVASATQRDAMNRNLPGGVGVYLADQVTQKLKIRCRWEKPGLIGRASPLHVSSQDRDDAELVGRAAVAAALQQKHAHMVALTPLPTNAPRDGYELVPLAKLGGEERVVPAEWLNDSDLAVTEQFQKYVRRIVGELVDYPLPLKGSGT